MTPFVIFGLPRSRTFWLSRFLSYRDWNCGHDELRHARSMDDVKAWFSQENTGTVETSAAPWWRLVPDGVRVITIRRSVEGVIDSLSRLGFDPSMMRPIMARLDRKLDQIEARIPGVLSVRYADLENEGTCRELFEHCLSYPHDPKWWSTFAAMNLQVSMSSLVRYMAAYQPQLDKLAKIARQRTIAGMTRSAEIDGITIQQESFDDFLRDGVSLFREHLMLVGEAPDNYLDKNLPMMRAIDEAGGMQITTGRSNGRMFGYLMAIINPSLEVENELTALHLTFYASPDARGLGMKLQRASLDGLRARGVHKVAWVAGSRGDGPRLGTIYRRLGAEEFGQLYTLDLKDAA